ncbi:uncharacterized protein [Euphorbia lathyris]|uniref:uncharacterized protein n=1 Tax=Euphorbia lathyris TaxID=212925 RepID=UPI00331337F2
MALEYSYKTKPSRSRLLNSVFMSTVDVAAKSLVSVASNLKIESSYRWKPRDHFKFMLMLMTWFSVWVIRLFIDYFPFSPHSLLPFSSNLQYDYAPPSSSSSSSMAILSTYSTPSSMDLILQDPFHAFSVDALGRVLTNILSLLNEIPASSRKYQFAMAMAEKIMDGNFSEGHDELMEVNRMALGSAFGRTLRLLNRSLEKQQGSNDFIGASTLIKALPLGSHISSYVNTFKLCLRIAVQTVKAATGQFQKRYEISDDVVPEKLAQELLWITNKLQSYGFVSEAMMQWSYASTVASLAFTANPRVQGFIVKISATILRDLGNENIQVPNQVKFRLLVLWLPLFSHANNGLSYPFLTGFEKMEVERAMDQVISTLSATDQEVILTNWLQDFTISASDWPNLQLSYDRWCTSTRQLAF